MSSQEEPVKILAPHSFRQALSRRSLFQMGGAAAGLAILAACGDDDVDSQRHVGRRNGSARRHHGGWRHRGGRLAAMSATAAPASASHPATTAVWSTSPSGSLAMYTWGAYNDPDVVGSLAESDLGIKMKVDYYASNEDLITKLQASKGTSGFDIVVPTGPFVPQMIQNGLLAEVRQVEAAQHRQHRPGLPRSRLGPDQRLQRLQGLGLDRLDVRQDQDHDARSRPGTTSSPLCQGEASKNCSILDSPGNITGMYFWANGIDWTTEETADLDAAEKFLVDEFATHVKAFDSYPSDKIAEGAYILSMMWNGDARAAYPKIVDAGGNPDDWVWGLGAPETELWMDNYCIPTGAPNPDAAHAWINWLMIPEISIKDLDYHGYNSRSEEHGRAARRPEARPEVRRHDLLHRRAGRDDAAPARSTPPRTAWSTSTTR